MTTTTSLKITEAPAQYVDVDGVKTHYVQVGSGFPILVLHGGSPGACARVIYGAVMEPLAERGFAVFGIDAPGFGLTEVPDDPAKLSADYRVRHTQAFATALGLDRFHVIGNSAGVYPSFRLGLEDARVNKVVAIAGGGIDVQISQEAQEQGRRHGQDLASYTPGLDNMRQLTLGTLHRDELLTDELVQLRYDMSVGAVHEAAERRRQGGSGVRNITREEFNGYKPRTLILWGKNDGGSALERAYRMFEAVPNAELHTFDNCGHWPMWDQRDRFVQVVGDFLLNA